jgi:hypothetical protein
VPNRAPSTAYRHDALLRALHNVALKVKDDKAQRAMVGGLIALGVGAISFYLLTQPRRSVGAW